MYFDLFLLSTIVAALYFGQMVIRRRPPGRRGYGYMLLADGLCALLALVLRHLPGDSALGDPIGVAAVACGAALVIAPSLLRAVGQRAMLANWLGVARLLAAARDRLQPDMGGRGEVELLDTLIAARTGRTDRAVEALRQSAARSTAPGARRALAERVVLTYLSARRWDQAIAAYEEIPGTGGAAGAEAAPGPVMTRVAPHVAVELVRAYCEVGDLGQAAAIVTHIESSGLAGEPMLTLLIARMRMIVL
ncbi:MAG: hypothetical protein AAGC55_29560, partial [Myxococcota bacterium]